MMKMKRSIIYISLFLALGAPACQETEVAPTVNDGVAPGPVTVSGVTNLSGAAEIYFQLPSDDDVLYVKGQYSTADGQVRESKVSYYNRRSEEHTSELQSLMRISYAVFCLKKKKKSIQKIQIDNI